MDRGQLTFLQTKIDDRTYLLFCDPMSPIPEIRQAICYFIEELEKIEQEHLQAQIEPPCCEEKLDG